MPSVALGSGEVTLSAITAAYGAFANNGAVFHPHLVRRVVDRDGLVLFENKSVPQQAIRPVTAYLMADMLRGVIDGGTAYGVRQMGFSLPAGGKTGTTNDYKDAWFIGFTPSLVTGVWVGYDQPQTIRRNGYAAELAVPMWTRFMKVATKGDEAVLGESAARRDSRRARQPAAAARVEARILVEAVRARTIGFLRRPRFVSIEFSQRRKALPRRAFFLFIPGRTNMRHEVTTRRVLYEIPRHAVRSSAEDRIRGRERRVAADGDLPIAVRPVDRSATASSRSSRGIRMPVSSRTLGCKFMEMEWTISMARLIAASGMVAITHSNREPEPDALALMHHLARWTSESVSGRRQVTVRLRWSAAVARRSVRVLINPVTKDFCPDTPLFVFASGKDETPGLNAGPRCVHGARDCRKPP